MAIETIMIKQETLINLSIKIVRLLEAEGLKPLETLAVLGFARDSFADSLGAEEIDVQVVNAEQSS